MSLEPAAGEVSCATPDGGRHVLRWTEWGDPANVNLLFCAHGLSRNGRDFDYLARALMPHYRVVCPDYPGRGRSDRLADPVFYNNEQNVRDTLTLLEHLEYDRLDWVGTSMGGLIGMALAALPRNPMSAMIINDVGAFIPKSALQQISDYLGIDPRFSDLKEAENYYRTVYAGFGVLEDEHYRHLVRHGVVEAADGGGYVPNYDRAIVDVLISAPLEDVDLWNVWAQISIPVLIIRGEQSGLLLPDTVAEMKRRHPGADSVEFAGCAHAPSLMTPPQIQVIADWLAGQRGAAGAESPGA